MNDQLKANIFYVLGGIALVVICGFLPTAKEPALLLLGALANKLRGVVVNGAKTTLGR
jgi:hypothetical protein